MAPSLKANDVIDRTRRQKRIELSNLLERFYFSDDGTVGLYQTEHEQPFASSPVPEEVAVTHDGSYQDSSSCPQHEKVKVRNGRCPLCAAADTRLRRRSSCGSVESEGGCSNSSSGVHDSSKGVHENGEEEGRGQLDPKWAGALRQISSRLADGGRTCSSDDLCLNEMNHTVDSAAAGCHRPLSKSFNGGSLNQNPHKSELQQDSQQHHHHLGSLSQLRQMIVMAQASVGRFTPNDDFDINYTDNDTNRHQEGEREGYYSCDDDEQDDDSLLDRSISSMMESQIKNNFAESKGLSSEQHRGRLDTIVKQFVPVSSLQRTNGGGGDDNVNLVKNSTDTTIQHQEKQLPSSNNKELPKSMTVLQLLPPNKIGCSDGTLISSHSDSSITLSLSSSSSTGVRCCLESRNGTVTAATAPATSNDSPTCVSEMPQCSSSNSAESSSLSPTAMETAGRGGEPNIPFGPPFGSSLEASSSRSKARQGQSSKNTLKQQSVSSAAPTVEEVYSDTDEEENDDGEVTVAPIPSSSSKGPPPPPTASSRPSRRQCSFISALVQNARSSRSKSRSRASRSRSKSRGRAKSRSKSRGRGGSLTVEQQDVVVVDDVPKESSDELKCTKHSREAERQPESVIRGDQQDAVVQSNSTQIMNNPEPATPSRNDVPPAANTPKPQPEYIRLCPKYEFPPLPSGVRGPILHPDYQLGDPAQEQDMIVFPSCKSRKGRRRHRRRHGNGNHDDDDDSSDEESHDRFSSAKVRSIVESAIGQLCHLDAAFVRRSDGSWTYAIMADRTEDAIRFVVNEKGSTKSYPQKLWGSSVRRIRVLTQREGDRFLFKDCTNGGVAASKRRRSIGNSRGGRGRSLSKGKGRLTSPSPTRRNTGVLNIPPTILEHHRHGRH